MSPPFKNAIAGSYNFTVPAGVTSIFVEGRGAGCGGRNADTQNRKGGPGGTYVNKTLTVTPLSVFPYTIGAAGPNYTGASQSVGAGGDTIFGSSLAVAPGGASSTTAVGDVINAGGAGGLQGSVGLGGGGGGAPGDASGIGGAGGVGGNTTGGAGGTNTSGIGSGGAGGTGIVTPAGAGVSPGGGGGGGGFNVTAANGANGADGAVWITYTVQPTTFTISTSSPTAINVPSAITATLDQVATSTVTISTTSSTGETIANFTVVIGQTVSTGGTWTPLHAGSSTLTFTNDSSLTNPSPQVVTVTDGAGKNSKRIGLKMGLGI